MRTLIWNARSLRHQVKQIFLQNIRTDLIIITKTWDPGFEWKLANSVIRRREDSTGGGTLVWVKNPNIKILKHFTFSTDSLLVQATIEDQKTIWIVALYIPNSSSTRECLMDMANAIECHAPVNQRNSILIAGDFNIDMTKKNLPSYKLLMLYYKKFKLKVAALDGPTREKGKATIDYAILGSSFNALSVQRLNVPISDHFMVTVKTEMIDLPRAKVKISVSNKKLATKITKNSLIHAQNALELLAHQFIARELKINKRILFK